VKKEDEDIESSRGGAGLKNLLPDVRKGAPTLCSSKKNDLESKPGGGINFTRSHQISEGNRVDDGTACCRKKRIGKKLKDQNKKGGTLKIAA